MIVVRLIGGLGNQMLQYAAARAMADRLGTELVMDLRGFASYPLRAFGLEQMHIRARRATEQDLARFPETPRTFLRLLNKFISLPTRYYFEPYFNFNPAWPNLRDRMQLNGYFHSERYFGNIRAQLQQDFIPKREPGAKNEELIALAQSTQSVMLHVRRGDYVTVNQNTKIFGMCSLDYYRTAIELMRQKTSSPRFFVFSDDISWARANLPLGEDAIYVEGNMDCPEMDIHLMSKCRYHVIANSSFSWWGAWLADNAQPHVIAPDPWFDTTAINGCDILPPSWERLRK